MIEKVNPSHPDKVADRIAGALVDLAYKKSDFPKIAVEALLGHGKAYIIAETSVKLGKYNVADTVRRISGISDVRYVEVAQDVHLSDNQENSVRCGDNGIFRGMPITYEQKLLTRIAKSIYMKHPTDGKYLINIIGSLSCPIVDTTICQSFLTTDKEASLEEELIKDYGVENVVINPLGPWTGGLDVDSGATNRKLGSDMGDAVTGGGLHGKDLSKADVSVNIMCHLLAQSYNMPVKAMCNIGDEQVTFRYGSKHETHSYAEVVQKAHDYIFSVCGGFEEFAKWGLIR